MKPTTEFTFPDNVRRAFSDGDCWVLAQAMYEEAMYPIVTATGTSGMWIHAANLLPDGNIVDVFGVWNADTWVNHWQADSDRDTYISSLYGTIRMAVWGESEFQDELDMEGFSPNFSESDDADTYAASIVKLIEETTNE
jgi:hypothetical protein